MDVATAQAKANKFFETVGRKIKTDCEAGCSYCCHQPATAFAFEAIRIAEVLKKTRTKEELALLEVKLKDRVKNFTGTSVSANVNNKTACPLLVDNKCSVYEDRPLTCRMAHSFSVKKCKLSFEKDRTKVQIPGSIEIVRAISEIIEEAYFAGENLYELSSAVLHAFTNNDLKSFKNCIKDDT